MTIGVASVIVLIAVGNGSSKAVQSTIQSLGTNVLRRAVQRRLSRRRAGEHRGTVSLTKADAEALQNPSLAPDVKSASPVVNATDVSLVYDGTSFEPSSFVGTTPSYLTAHCYKLAEGAAFTAEDVSKHRRVAVIGQEVVQELFAGSSAVGQNMKVNGTNYEVVGVLAKKGTNGTTNEDDVVMAPITTVQDPLTGVGPIDSITVRRSPHPPSTRPKARSARSSRNATKSKTPPNPASASSTRARCWKRRAPPAASSRRCSARSPRSRCSSAGSA